MQVGVDGADRLLSVVVTSGQRNDGAVLREVIDDVRVPRVGDGRPRANPNAVLTDRAYPTKATREYLRARGTRTVIPEKINQVTARKKKDSVGGRPPGFDAEVYKGRDIVERAVSKIKQWRWCRPWSLPGRHL
ncbi:transposase [Corynebacterium sp. CNJ-954]|uniref:transposase n=1 Tax=Corynebacterium sp. CNJ-954 TaxID=1904962 RepID=UPI002100DA4B|nr:transposase [Corynebacterium sp. CNJ-954]